jgi:hypothetical protein
MELKSILKLALKNLDKLNYLDEYMKYLESEFFYTINDLKLAIKDEGAWSEIKLPVRLKLELKKLASKLDSPIVESDKLIYRWTKCYSEEHNSFYYFNNENSSTQWELPDEPYDEDPSVTYYNMQKDSSNENKIYHSIPDSSCRRRALIARRPSRRRRRRRHNSRPNCCSSSQLSSQLSCSASR